MLNTAQIRQIADNLFCFPHDSAARQLAIHVASGDFTQAEADRIADAVDRKRRGEW